MKKILLMICAMCMAVGQAQAQQYVTVLDETFARCTSTKIQGGYFAEDSYFQPADEADNAGWYSQNTYPSERAVKLGTKKKTGYITSPALQLTQGETADLRITLRAQLWFTGTTKDTARVAVQIDGDDSSVQYIDATESTNVEDRSQPKYELYFTGVKNGSKLKFTSEKSGGMSRFFITEINVAELHADNTTPQLDVQTRYHHFDDIMAGNDSELRTIDVVGENLDQDISISYDAARPNFSVSTDDGWDNRRGGRLTIAFNPANAGAKLDTVVIAAGEQSYNVLLTGNAKVYRPTVDTPRDISDNSFTAAWQPLAGADKFVVTVYTKATKPLVATDLMITKYIEGKSNNRALEIYNGTGKAVSLSGYKLRMESNGAGGVTANEFCFPDRTLDNGDTYTIVNANFNNDAVRAEADSLIGYGNGGYANIVVFTGDDAIGLFSPDDTMIDLIGYEHEDVNDRVNGDWGADKTFYRKASVYQPQPKFYVEEWDEYAMDYADGFGTHTMDSEGSVRESVAELTVDGTATSVAVTGLQPSTTYYYAVKALSADWTTPYTQEATATTTAGTVGINSAKATTVPFSLHGDMLTTTQANARVYTAEGMLLQPAYGGRTYRLAQHGVYIVKSDGKSVKLSR